jgi:hypothetical protein
MARYLDTYNDPAYPETAFDMNWTPDDETVKQRKRLIETACMALHAGEVPRRLGGDASGPELRADKRLSRQVENRLTSVLRQWGGQPADITEEYARMVSGDPETADEPGHTVMQAGAQVVWADWWPKHKVLLQEEARRIASHAVKLGKTKEGNRLVHRIELEYNMLDDVLGV